MTEEYTVKGLILQVQRNQFINKRSRFGSLSSRIPETYVLGKSKVFGHFKYVLVLERFDKNTIRFKKYIFLFSSREQKHIFNH